MATLDPHRLLADIRSYEEVLVREGLPEDASLRKNLQQSAEKLSRSLENGFGLTSRILSQAPVETMLVRLGVEMGVYQYLASSQTPMTAAAIAKATGADSTLLDRVLRGLDAFGSILHTRGAGYSLCRSAEYLADPEFAESFVTCMDWMHPVFQTLPKKLAAEGYKLPQTDPRDLALQLAHDDRGKTLFEMFQSRSQLKTSFAELMSVWARHDSLVHDSYPVSLLLDGFDHSASDVLMVDVGGSWGQKSIALKKAHPEIVGRLIIQDLPYVVAGAPQTDLVEYQAHDFFTLQPMKDARIYYLCKVLHDWSDDNAVKVLENIRPAMKPGYSRVLIHEMVLPKSRAAIWPVTGDFTMMTLLGASERSLENWEHIIHRAGLQLLKVHPPPDPSSEAIIEAARIS